MEKHCNYVFTKRSVYNFLTIFGNYRSVSTQPYQTVSVSEENEIKKKSVKHRYLLKTLSYEETNVISYEPLITHLCTDLFSLVIHPQMNISDLTFTSHLRNALNNYITPNFVEVVQ